MDWLLVFENFFFGNENNYHIRMKKPFTVIYGLVIFELETDIKEVVHFFNVIYYQFSKSVCIIKEIYFKIRVPVLKVFMDKQCLKIQTH